MFVSRDCPGLDRSTSQHAITVALLTPSVVAIVLADSPPACIRRASAAFEPSSSLGRPMDCPRAPSCLTGRGAALPAEFQFEFGKARLQVEC
jgi:hypothetical protein